MPCTSNCLLVLGHYCELTCIMLSLTNYLLLIALAFLVGGFALINKFGVYFSISLIDSLYVSSNHAVGVRSITLVEVFDRLWFTIWIWSLWYHHADQLCFLWLAPDATQFGEHTITQKHLYTGLFVIGIPLLWYASPIGTIFWIIGASAVLILGHASLMEPGVESDYASIDGGTV